MATQLPVHIRWRLPDGWTAAPPDEVDAPGAAFVALHLGSAEHGFTANITIAGKVRPPNMSLDTIGDESVARLARSVDSATLRERTQAGSSMTQVLDLTTTATGRELRLAQHQIYLTVRDAEEPAKHAVLEFVLTCTPDQLPLVRDDFRALVTSVRP